MNQERDQRLLEAFAEDRRDLAGDEFTDRVMVRTRFLRYRLHAALLAGAALMVGCLLVLAPSLQGFALLVARGLTTTLVDLGDGWLALAFAPVNTMGSLLIIGVKALRMGQKRLMRAPGARRKTGS